MRPINSHIPRVFFMPVYAWLSSFGEFGESVSSGPFYPLPVNEVFTATIVPCSILSIKVPCIQKLSVTAY